MSYRLSFCIPTYNRAPYLRETLGYILDQADESIEIVISDNASTDNTEEVVAEAKLRFPNITYYRWPANMGADRNYMKTVELATGDYCWFMGSDDGIKKGAVKRVLDELKLGHDIYMCSQYFCDKKLKPYVAHYLLPKGIPDSVFNFSNEKELIRYFQLAQSHSALFGYLSTIIFKREKWRSVKYDDSYTGTLYSHMFMLYSFLNKGCVLKYISEPLVYWRGGNDSFGGPGKIQGRFMIDFNGFKRIMDSFFVGRTEVLVAFRGAFRRHHPLMSIAWLRVNTASKKDWLEIEQMLVADYEYNPVAVRLMRCAVVKSMLHVLTFFRRAHGKIWRTIAPRADAG